MKHRARAAHLARMKQRRHRRDHPLRYLNVPYSGYQSWFPVPRTLEVGPESLAPTASLLDDDLNALGWIIHLAPHYNYEVPMAAVKLEIQIRQQEVSLAGHDTPVMLDQIAQGAGVTVSRVSCTLHKLHNQGSVFIDDDMAIHPYENGRRWSRFHSKREAFRRLRSLPVSAR